MANTIIRHDVIAVRGHRATLLLLLIALATVRADKKSIRPDGPNNTYGRRDDNGTDNSENKPIDFEKVYNRQIFPLDLSLKTIQYPEIDTTKIDLDLLNNVTARRVRVAESILKFKFQMKRVKWLTGLKGIQGQNKGIVYWMSREQRVQDNWSLLFAQNLALRRRVPLHVVFCRPNKIWKTSLRQFIYMIQGLKEVQKELQLLNIQFHFLYGKGSDVLPDFVKKHKFGAIVVDFMPLKEYTFQIKQLTNIFQKKLPIIMVDAHNVVPCWVARQRASKTPARFRVKLKKAVKDYLTEFPPIVAHPFISNELVAEPINWNIVDRENFDVDRSVLPVPGVKVGYVDGILELEHFLKYKLRNYSKTDKDPTVDGLSNLSPWLHFGQISPQRVILELNRFSLKYKIDASTYREEIFTRRELADNFCNYNQRRYDFISSAWKWAISDLDKHRNDTRSPLYTRYQLGNALTHDKLWNAAQMQMITEGKMHRFMRMYWAKKFLLWMERPEEALATVIYLNNKFSLDGDDPNSYVGCMWAICGVHDRPWKNNGRPIFGRIRYLDELYYKKKFDVEKYIKKYQPLFNK